jgi:hypothetical protein
MNLSMRIPTLVLVIGLVTACGFAQQVADPDFDTKVQKPAYTSEHPRVLFDEAHHNFHTSSGRYKPFADLIRNDGYSVTPNKQPLEKKSLSGYDILVISNALGADAMGSPQASNPAFTEEECDAIRNWVRDGGSLLLIADHAPMGAAAERLSLKFGVEMAKGFTEDPANYDIDSNNKGFLKFNRKNKLLADHPITQGRDASERISKDYRVHRAIAKRTSGKRRVYEARGHRCRLDSSAGRTRRGSFCGGAVPRPGTPVRERASGGAWGGGDVVGATRWTRQDALWDECSGPGQPSTGTEHHALAFRLAGLDNSKPVYDMRPSEKYAA